MPRTRQLDAREDDWIAASRSLSYSQIALYLGAFLLFAGSLFYFAAHRIYDAVRGIVRPFFILGLPFLGLNAAGRWLYRQDHRAVAVAFYLAGVSLLPLFLLIWFHETRLLGRRRRTRLVRSSATARCPTASCRSRFSSRASGRAGWRFGRARARSARCSRCSRFCSRWRSSRTSACGAGSRTGRYDLLALHLCAARAALRAPAATRSIARPGVVRAPAVRRERSCRSSRCSTCSRSTAGCSTTWASRWSRCSRPAVSNPVLIDTLAALSLNGVLFYGVAWLVERARFGRHCAGRAAAVYDCAVLHPRAARVSE